MPQACPFHAVAVWTVRGGFPDCAARWIAWQHLVVHPGVFFAISYALAGAFLCITIIGIPFGLQAFKFIPLALAPFGKEVVTSKAVTARSPRVET
jgi:uncharacterized membrane protein YccF (DUF307 family)